MKISVVEIVEAPDGNCRVQLDLDEEALFYLAEIGFNKVMADAVEEALKELGKDDGHPDAEGAGNDQAGEGGDPPLP